MKNKTLLTGLKVNAEITAVPNRDLRRHPSSLMLESNSDVHEIDEISLHGYIYEMIDKTGTSLPTTYFPTGSASL